MAKKSMEEQVQEVIEAAPSGVCGHVNRHFVNKDGLPEDLVCDLPARHAGNHEADYLCLRPRNGTIQDAKLKGVMISGKEYVEKTERGEWSDAAATPVEETEPDKNQLAYIRQHKAELILAENLARK